LNPAGLSARLDSLISSLKSEERTLLQARLQTLISAFPFNQYEYTLMTLLHNKVISFTEYETLRGLYVSGNKYLELYGLAPRIFGEIWGQKHLMDLDARFVKPNKKLDPKYDGEYDLRVNSSRIEVKAARAINTKKRGDLVSKALHHASTDPFWMNFQQIKLDVCDAFIFLGVWVDSIVYWVLSLDEVKSNPYLSHQHRGGVEYQIGITQGNIREFDCYKVEPPKLVDTILKKDV